MSSLDRARALVLAVTVLLSAGVAARARAQTDAPDEVTTRVASAEALFEAENYESALAEFERVYELIEGQPSAYFVLFNIGQCHERLFRYDRAIEYYQRYLEVGGPEAEDRPMVEGMIRALESLLGTIEIVANVTAATVWIDEIEIGAFDAEHRSFRVPAGRHTVELRADGYVPGRAEVLVAARTEVTADIDLSLLSTYEGLDPWLFWASAGIGAATLVVGAGFGISALVRSNDAHARCETPACDPASLEAWRQNNDALAQSIADDALVADILYGVGGTFALTAVVLAFLTDWDGPTRSPSEAWLLVPSVGPDRFGVTLGGTF